MVFLPVNVIANWNKNYFYFLCNTLMTLPSTIKQNGVLYIYLIGFIGTCQYNVEARFNNVYFCHGKNSLFRQFVADLYNSYFCVKLHLLKMNFMNVEEFHLLLVLP